MILTNKFNAELNMDAIDKDFDIYVVDKESQKLDRCNILDIPETKFNALAVQYQFGRKAFVLFQKNTVLESEFRESLQSEFKDVSVYHVTLEDLQDEKFCKDHFFYGDRLLVQLLLNSIRAPRNESLTYNNLTGKLYYAADNLKNVDKKTGVIWYMSYLEIKLDPGMFLNLDVKTFGLSSYGKSGRQYVLDPKTGVLRKRLATDEDSLPTYTEKAQNGKHKTVDFLEISSFKKFQECKLGIMERFLRDVKRLLSEYVTLTPMQVEESQEYEVSKKEKEGLSEKGMGNILKQRGVVIVDENKTERSKEIVKKLKYELQKHYGVLAKEGELEKDKYNVRIIHTPEYYERLEIEDLHNATEYGFIVQHLVEEKEHFNDKQSASPAINKIIQELIIKGDVLDRMITIYDWKKLGANKAWTFVRRKKIFNQNGEKVEHVNSAGKKVFNYFKYDVLEVNKEGNLNFYSFTDAEYPYETEEHERIIRAFDRFHKEYQKDANEVEGLVYSNIENIHAIILTPEKTIPNTETIWDGLRETTADKRVNKADLLEAMEAFVEECELDEKTKDYIETMKLNLMKEDDVITIGRVCKMMGMKKKAAKKLNRFMHENCNIWISAEMKDQYFESEYQIGNMLNIKYYQLPDYQNIPTFYYFVGPKRTSLQNSINNACAVRKVVSETGEIEYRELLPLMAVEFVRNKQYTVLPFPFKYLREYDALEGDSL